MNLTECKKRRAEAKQLKRNMDKLDKQHSKLIEKWGSEVDSRRKRSTEHLQRLNEEYRAQDKALDTQENLAYKAYYYHMNKDFNANSNKIKFTSKKYKDGFTDMQYIDDLYDQMENQIRKQMKKERKRKMH